MAPRKFSGPIQQGAIQVLRDMEVASTQEVARRRKKPRVSGAEYRRNVERPHMRYDPQIGA